MANIEPPVRKKVKDSEEGLNQAIRVTDFLEEADFLYDLGIAQPFLCEIKRHLNQAIGFYNRHHQPDSNLRAMAKRQLRLANKLAVGALVRGLNQLLRAGGHQVITIPTSITELETACGQLFHYVGEPVNVREPEGGGGTQVGAQNVGTLPMA